MSPTGQIEITGQNKRNEKEGRQDPFHVDLAARARRRQLTGGGFTDALGSAHTDQLRTGFGRFRSFTEPPVAPLAFLVVKQGLEKIHGPEIGPQPFRHEDLSVRNLPQEESC